MLMRLEEFDLVVTRSTELEEHLVDANGMDEQNINQ